MAAALHRRGLSTAAAEGVASPRLRVRGKTHEQMARLLAGDQTGGDRPRRCLRAQHGRRTFARYHPPTGEKFVRQRSGRRFPRSTASSPPARWMFATGRLKIPGLRHPWGGPPGKRPQRDRVRPANEALICALWAWFRPRRSSPVHIPRIHARSTTARRPLARRRLLEAPARRSPDRPYNLRTRFSKDTSAGLVAELRLARFTVLTLATWIGAPATVPKRSANRIGQSALRRRR